MKKIHKILLIMTLIIFPLLVFGCKNDTIEDTGLDVKSNDGDYPSPHIVVHYKTEKRYLNVGEDLNVNVSFGRTRDDTFDYELSTAELIMDRGYQNELSEYEVVESQTLKIIDDFSSDEYKGTFTTDENILDVTIKAEWFDDSCDAIRFTLWYVKDFLADDGHTYTLGVGAVLYYKIIEDKIKLYGSFYDFKNDK